MPRKDGHGKYIGTKGKEFRAAVIATVLTQAIKGVEKCDRLNIKIDLYPPDKRKRDIDNMLKPLLDSLQNAGIIFDDAQFDKLCVERHYDYDGYITVTIHRC
jgi:crossover junction endodeoxyribonuclease RusA